ncbi:acyltransferase [Psychrobacter sp. Sarcosine-02u-2]|uniref:acyltransferase n=1 Tax=Psychrobacter sp. Sarcosine-02u-2 TaxID=2058324 RepID=UPI000C798F63|nr:acyltransferase [Psychrobacter sp. Sarcosine-02u-2]PKG88820.1 acyltransferase [Psychrobacter sp. Sarcosine-02u-2]
MSKLSKELAYQMRYALPFWSTSLALNWLPDISPSLKLRGFCLSLILPNRPKNLLIGRDVTLLSINRLKLGNNIYIAKGSWINAIGGIEFEDEVVLAPYVVMSSSNHGFKEGSVQRGGAHPAPIKIGFGSWIAAHSVIAAGVTIGKGNLIAANSVVTRDTLDNVVVAGAPAKEIKERIDNPSTITSKHDIEVN